MFTESKQNKDYSHDLLLILFPLRHFLTTLLLFLYFFLYCEFHIVFILLFEIVTLLLYSVFIHLLWRQRSVLSECPSSLCRTALMLIVLSVGSIKVRILLYHVYCTCTYDNKLLNLNFLKCCEPCIWSLKPQMFFSNISILLNIIIWFDIPI